MIAAYNLIVIDHVARAEVINLKIINNVRQKKRAQTIPCVDAPPYQAAWLIACSRPRQARGFPRRV